MTTYSLALYDYLYGKGEFSQVEETLLYTVVGILLYSSLLEYKARDRLLSVIINLKVIYLDIYFEI